MPAIKNLLNKVNPLKLLKKKPFDDVLFTNMSEQFALTSMDEINDTISHVGLELAYNGNGDRVGLLFIKSIRPSRADDSPIKLFDEATQKGYQIYVLPSAAFKYTVYNKKGQITSTIVHSSGQDSPVMQISGSKDFYTIEGEIL